MPQPILELGGHADNPLINLLPANGFVPETYHPLMASFTDAYRVISTPPRALWGDGAPPVNTLDHSWYNVADDLLNAHKHFDLPPSILIGHSIGGVLAILASCQRPSAVRALILLDPVILPRAACDWMREQRQQGEPLNPQLAERALRRRAQFASIEDAFDHFHGKSIFADWADDTLRLYAEHGTIPCEGGRCLRWSPQWEAFYFSTYYTEIWDELPRLNALDLPILFVAGGASDTFLPDTVQAVREIVPLAEYATLAGGGHLFPHSAPQATAQIIADWLVTHTS
ncbi:MAG: alpha/beta fold hydrolase [Anaerolineae bacterium]